MKKSKLVPFLKPNLELLFIGLNPAKGSNDNGHYFSVNQAFWNQLHDSSLITKNVDKADADNIIFGSNILNFNSWHYGVTDLVTQIAESNSIKVKPTIEDCERLKSDILKYRPIVAVILHAKVLKCFLKYLGKPVPISNTGSLGQLIQECDTAFYNIAFPHGNSIASADKVQQYRRIKEFIIDYCK